MKIVALYMKELMGREVKAKENGKPLEHALWMLTELVIMGKDKPLRLARWIGLVQGILLIEKIYTFEEMNGHSKEMLVADLHDKKIT